MATVTFHQPFSMWGAATWYGEITSWNASRIVISDGTRTQEYLGSFRYDSWGLSSGYATGTRYYEAGRLVYEVSGFNVNAVALESQLDRGGDYAASYLLSGNDLIRGSEGDDILVGYTGNDRFEGRGGNDIFVKQSGSDHFDGGAGLDVVAYTLPHNVYTVTFAGDHFQLTNRTLYTDTFNDVERLVFGDNRILALDVLPGENAGSVFRLYQAAFDRRPDLDGLNFWLAQADSGRDIKAIANDFVASAEFRALNPGLDNASIIRNYYLNVLDREPDEGGFNYWSQRMEEGMAANDLLVHFSESAENVANTWDVLQGGLWLA